ncbi:MAG: phosphopantetheine-binding protein [Catenulispora sp.]
MRLREAADRFGTPLYLYDLAEVTAARRQLCAALPSGSVLHYSLKANPHPAIVGVLAAAGLRAEVSSTGELATALAAGFEPAAVTYSGPAKTGAELAVAVRAGVRRFSVESLGDLRSLDAAAERAGRSVEFLLRVNADRPVPGMGLAMAGTGSKFGVDHSQVAADPGAFRTARAARFAGLHLYMGTNLPDEDVLTAQFETALAVAADLGEAFGTGFAEVDLGGGFGAPYARPGARQAFPGLRPRLEELLDRRLPGWRDGVPVISFESGRYLVASCGTLVTRVVDTKVSKGERFAVLDSGVHHLGGMSGLRRLPAVAPVVIPVAGAADAAAGAATARDRDADRDADPAVTQLVGPLCTPLDRWGAAPAGPDIAIGDLLAVPNVGAYGLSASLIAFLGHPAPVEVAVAEDGTATASRLTVTRIPAPGTDDRSPGDEQERAVNLDPDLHRLLSRNLPLLAGRELTADTELSEFGLDSMRAVDLLFDIEDTFGVILPDQVLAPGTFTTPRALWSAILAAEVGR